MLIPSIQTSVRAHRFQVWGLMCVALLAATACAGEPSQATPIDDCQGTLLGQDHEYCVHKGIVVTGFRCPPDFANRIDVPGSSTTVAATVCTRNPEVSIAELQTLLESEDPGAVICVGSHNGQETAATLVHQTSLCESAWVITTPVASFRFSSRPEARAYRLSRPDEWSCASDSAVAMWWSDSGAVRSAGAYYPGEVVFGEVSRNRIVGQYLMWQGRSAISGTFEISGNCQPMDCDGTTCADGELCVSHDGRTSACTPPEGTGCDEMSCSALGCPNGARAEDNRYVCLTDPWEPEQWTH